MEPFRLKLKVGPHEFEAEGARETVAEQLAIWRELIASPNAMASPPPAPQAVPPAESVPTAPLGQPITNGDISRAEFDKLFQHDGRLVYLTALPLGERREADAALLLLLGQRLYNSTDLVTGGQLLDGLQRSGLGKPGRADLTLKDYIEQQHVIRSGAHRGVKYRLTPPGVVRAKEIAKELLKMVG